MTNTHHVTYESIFQTDIVTQIQAKGWQVGSTSSYQVATLVFGGYE